MEPLPTEKKGLNLALNEALKEISIFRKKEGLALEKDIKKHLKAMNSKLKAVRSICARVNFGQGL